MHDVLRQRLMRRIESLPEEQVYQVLDYIEFLESKYARDLAAETSGLRRFAENLEDRMRKKAMNPATLREAFQLISAADRVLSVVSSAGRQILDDLSSLGEPGGTGPEGGDQRAREEESRRPPPALGRRDERPQDAGRPEARSSPTPDQEDEGAYAPEAEGGEGEPDDPGEEGRDQG